MKRKECTSKDTQSVALTIYNDDFGLVEGKSSDFIACTEEKQSDG